MRSWMLCKRIVDVIPVRCHVGRCGSGVRRVSSSSNDVLEQVLGIFTSLRANSSQLLVMSGAGLSTPSGIPDFRTPSSGLYDNVEKYHLPYPEAIFDIEFFRQNPGPFNAWSKEFLPGVNYKPSIGHFFVRLLQDHGLLLRHYTQNIDGLDLLAGVEEDKIVASHGSFSEASCIECRKPGDVLEVKDILLNDGTPVCHHCGGLVKPDIVFFGEMLPQRFHDLQHSDLEQAKLLICIGTSLEVYPFAGIADLCPFHVPRLLLNRQLVGSFGKRKLDYFLGGDLTQSLSILIDGLGWSDEMRRHLTSVKEQ